MSADANTSAGSPRSSRSLSNPEAPNSSRTGMEYRAVKRSAISVNGARRLPAA